jgi:metallo-beta-lactamase class B
LLDGTLPQATPQIAANIEELGFHLKDVKLIVNSHAHFDHAGGIHALARASGAEVAASASGAIALERGRPTDDDPQYAIPDNSFPAVPRVRVVADRETLRVGSLAITAHLTPGHTPGSTTWTWRSCESGRCLDVVYADSLTSVSADGFRFTGGPDYPSRVETFRASIAQIAGLPCDVLLSPHPWIFQMTEKLAKRTADAATNPFVDAGACKAYATAAEASLDKRVADEGKPAAP